jgi:hypothetical protein
MRMNDKGTPAPSTDPAKADIRQNAAEMLWSPDWLGENRHLYRPELWRPAREIKVARLRQIFIWPLVLRMRVRDPDTKSKFTVDALMEETATALIRAERNGARIWTELNDLANHAPPSKSTRKPNEKLAPDYEVKADAIHRYGEFVYFYDFLQVLLFRGTRGLEGPQAIRIFSRTDVTSLEATSYPSVAYRASVDRCNLYLFGSGAAALIAEVDFGVQPTVEEAEKSRPMTLADAQRFIDVARRAYPPAYDLDGGGRTWPLYTPTAFKWLNGNCPVGESTALDFCDAQDLTNRVDAKGVRVAPMSNHWKALIEPLAVAGSPEAEAADGPVWRHVVDDRIPIMSYISMTGAASRFGSCKTAAEIAEIKKDEEQSKAQAAADRADLRLVSRGDWLRLCYADSPGQDPMPYSPDFFGNFEEAACYDRYFPSEATTSSLRYMFAGYHFCVVGAGDYFDHTAVHHFRRHYFQMGLVLNMEFALLLATSSRMSTAVNRFKQTASRQTTRSGKTSADDARALFRREFIAIKEDFLQFVHLYRFTDLSNQIQASEMFKKWRHAMGLDQVFADVKTELDTAAEFLTAEAQHEHASASTRLTLIAAVVATLALAFSFLGMNVLVDPGLLDKIPGFSTNQWWHLLARQSAIVGGVVALFGWLALRAQGVFREESRSANAAFGSLCRSIILVGALLCAAGSIVGWWPFPR